MGADSFECFATGTTASAAFRSAVERAQYDHGHSGYTGTIAEKDSFVIIPFNKEEDGRVDRFVSRLIDEGDERINDKWGPAGCIDLGPRDDNPRMHNYLFFGWASS